MMASLTEYWRKHYTGKKKYVLGQGHVLPVGHCVLCLNAGVLKSADLEETTWRRLRYTGRKNWRTLLCLASVPTAVGLVLFVRGADAQESGLPYPEEVAQREYEAAAGATERLFDGAEEDTKPVSMTIH
jgi:hypothetical protein